MRVCVLDYRMLQRAVRRAAASSCSGASLARKPTRDHCQRPTTLAACRYDQYSDAWDTSVVINVLGEDVRFFHANKKGVDRVFIDHPTFLAKARSTTRTASLC